MPPAFAEYISDFCAAYGRLLTLAALHLHDADGLPRLGWVRDELRLALEGRGITEEFHEVRRHVYLASALLMAVKKATRHDRAALQALADRAASVRRAVESEWGVRVPVNGARI